VPVESSASVQQPRSLVYTVRLAEFIAKGADNMAHDHAHDHGEHAGAPIFWHHQAEYNLEKIIRNLLLIQDHYAIDTCSNCLTKHWNLVQAYQEEGRTLENGEKFEDDFDKVEDLGNRHFRVILDCTVNNKCDIKNPHDMHRMIQEVRAMRRALCIAIYGIDSDVVHDLLAEPEGRMVHTDLDTEDDHDHEHVLNEYSEHEELHTNPWKELASRNH
jgi:hypothetical protein